MNLMMLQYWSVFVMVSIKCIEDENCWEIWSVNCLRNCNDWHSSEGLPVLLWHNFSRWGHTISSLKFKWIFSDENDTSSIEGGDGVYSEIISLWLNYFIRKLKEVFFPASSHDCIDSLLWSEIFIQSNSLMFMLEYALLGLPLLV